ncbi:MAG TPA: acyltransferase [Xanthobacteraceae bacterium]|nr:acyltransferase [Xanthobacteraceae bacterium]
MRRSHSEPQAVPRSSSALANLRGIVILTVLGFHSMLAYLNWIPAAGSGFDNPPYDWRSFPIIDSHRFFGFDLFCAWQDVYLMALMFFLSGLFVWPSLKRKTEWPFLRDRALRLGLPYAFGVTVIMPAALYPVYRLSAADPGLAGYWHGLLALPFWPNGPLWFIWQLLALNCAAAAVRVIAPDALPALDRWSAAAERHPLRYFAALLAAAAVAYVPLAVAFTPWAWADSGLFAVQFCRPLLYAVYFFAGVGLGAAGIERGLIAADGPVARHWAVALAAALATLCLWMGLTALTMTGGASLTLDALADLSFVPACAAGCFFLIAVCLRFATGPSRPLGFLSANAYGLYLVHYLFVVWLQYALLAMPWFAIVKAAIVFAGTLVLSLATVLVAQRLPWGARLIGTAPIAYNAAP